MNTEDHRDQLVDMLLRELVAEERPPDVRDRVMEAAGKMPEGRIAQIRPRVRPIMLASARPSRLPALAIAAAVTLLGVAGVFFHLRGIASVKSPVLTSHSGTVSRPMGVVRPGESLSTGAESSALLSYRDGTVMELGPDTSIVVTQRSIWDRSKGIELKAGEVRAQVVPQGERSSMVLSSEHAEAVVVGTRLSFQRDTDRTRLEVTEGAVRFDARLSGSTVLVNAGFFAEDGMGGFHTGPIVKPPVPGIVSFTLMNADTDQPIRVDPLKDGEKISLSSLPTRNLNIRADYEGDPPDSVRIQLRRHHGKATGLGSNASKVHEFPPFFVAGDHWADGRPDDCAAWQAPPGYYHLSAEAFYADEAKQGQSAPLEIKFWIDR